MLSIVAATAMAAAIPASPSPGSTFMWRKAHEKVILEQFCELLSLPNVATSVSDVEKNAAYITQTLKRRNFKTTISRAAPGTPPSVIGELRRPGARRTLVFYAHFDGQPVSQDGWRSPPFEPVIRRGGPDAQTVDWRSAKDIDPDWRIYARSASDDKAPIQAMLSALDALQATGRRPNVNIKVFYEGEEEQGSQHLPAILAANAPLLRGDIFLLSDGPRHQSGQMQIFFGARGSSTVQVTVYGPARPLHSGHYGNWAPNPAVMLTHLLDSLRDEEGQILIPGFSDDVRPLTADERRAIAQLPAVEPALRQELALGRTEGTESLAESIARPALNVRGIRVGAVGAEASNTISTEAKASIDFRLVPNQTPERVKELFEAHLLALGWHIVHEDPTLVERSTNKKVVRLDWSLSYPAYRADLSSSESRWVVDAVEKATGKQVLRVPMLGGSVPMKWFSDSLAMPVLGLPIANYDNNQHGANENLRIGNLWDGIELYAALLTSGR